MMRRPRVLVLSCEHAGNRVPVRYRRLFRGHTTILQTHRAYDLDIYRMARQIARQLDCPLFAFFTTRLLIDANRSPGHRGLLSEFSRELRGPEKQHLVRAYYQPYRQKVIDAIERHMAEGRCVLHVSLHSFTPTMSERERKADIGVLYDTKRREETYLAKHLQGLLGDDTGLRVRRNYPYRGAADGFTTFLRKRFQEDTYAGLEVELNQRLLEETPVGGQPHVGPLATTLSESLAQLICQNHQRMCPSSESDGR